MRRTVIASDTPRPLTWPPKDANEVLSYTIDFAERLGCDSIASATFTLATAAGLAIDASEHDSNKLATATISGGTAGQRGKVLCRITTTDGQTMDETVSLLVEAR